MIFFLKNSDFLFLVKYKIWLSYSFPRATPLLLSDLGAYMELGSDAGPTVFGRLGSIFRPLYTLGFALLDMSATQYGNVSLSRFLRFLVKNKRAVNLKFSTKLTGLQLSFVLRLGFGFFKIYKKKKLFSKTNQKKQPSLLLMF